MLSRIPVTSSDTLRMPRRPSCVILTSHISLLGGRSIFRKHSRNSNARTSVALVTWITNGFYKYLLFNQHFGKCVTGTGMHYTCCKTAFCDIIKEITHFLLNGRRLTNNQEWFDKACNQWNYLKISYLWTIKTQKSAVNMGNKIKHSCLQFYE